MLRTFWTGLVLRQLWRVPQRASHLILVPRPLLAFRSLSSSVRVQNLHPIKNQVKTSESPKKTLSKTRNEIEQTKTEISSAVYTIPNMLTMSRIAATPFIGYFIATGHSTAAISVFLYSCVTDALDGFIARRYNMKSVLGSILDPAADKFLMTVCTVSLGLKEVMPWYVAAVIVGRDVMLSFMAFYFRYRSLPPPKTLARFFDMSIVTHTVHPNMLGKINTALQMVYIGGLVLLPGIQYMAGSDQFLTNFFDWFGVVVAVSTFASGATYVFSKNAMKVLTKPVS